MKREREQAIDHSITMANCLMLLSRGGQFDQGIPSHDSPRVFECRTCNRQFSSFQALGGHRASHKKPRLAGAGGDGGGQLDEYAHHDSKPKTHECSICGLEFAIGQALGGHMRRHRAAALNNGHNKTHSSMMITMSSSSSGSSVENSDKVNSGNNRKRVSFLDLNLTPFENDLEFLKIEKPTPFEISALSI